MAVQQEIEKRLGEALAPEYLEVENESHQHNVPANSETHFRVVLVSGEFESRPRVARHQQVYAVLAALLEGPVHALALHTYTPGEWERRSAESPASPACLGGSKAEAS